MEEFYKGKIDQEAVVFITPGYATPVLDFYRALKGKAIKPWLDGWTKRARDYFRQTRHLLKNGQADFVLDDIYKALLLDDLPPA